MVPEPHRRALGEVCDRLEGRSLLWGVTGSVALVLQGVQVRCADLDLVTSAADADDVARLLAHGVVEPVAFRGHGGIRGRLWRLRVRDVSVEVLGDIQNLLPDGDWTAPPRLDQQLVWVAFGQQRCPVLGLAYLREAYEAMARPEKAQLIAAALSAQGR